MNTNKKVRRWPLTNSIQPRSVAPKGAGILYEVSQVTPSTNKNVEAISEHRRLNPIRQEGKWTAIMSSADVVASRKRKAIEKAKGPFKGTNVPL